MDIRINIGQSDADSLKESMLRSPTDGKLDQDDPTVVYMPPSKGPFRCGGCEYFVEKNSCKKVLGFIEPNACCNLFEPADEERDEVGEATSAEA